MADIFTPKSGEKGGLVIMELGKTSEDTAWWEKRMIESGGPY